MSEFSSFTEFLGGIDQDEDTGTDWTSVNAGEFLGAAGFGEQSGKPGEVKNAYDSLGNVYGDAAQWTKDFANSNQTNDYRPNLENVTQQGADNTTNYTQSSQNLLGGLGNAYDAQYAGLVNLANEVKRNAYLDPMEDQNATLQGNVSDYQPQGVNDITALSAKYNMSEDELNFLANELRTNPTLSKIGSLEDLVTQMAQIGTDYQGVQTGNISNVGTAYDSSVDAYGNIAQGLSTNQYMDQLEAAINAADFNAADYRSQAQYQIQQGARDLAQQTLGQMAATGQLNSTIGADMMYGNQAKYNIDAMSALEDKIYQYEEAARNRAISGYQNLTGLEQAQQGMSAQYAAKGADMGVAGAESVADYTNKLYENLGGWQGDIFNSQFNTTNLETNLNNADREFYSDAKQKAIATGLTGAEATLKANAALFDRIFGANAKIFDNTGKMAAIDAADKDRYVSIMSKALDTKVDRAKDLFTGNQDTYKTASDMIQRTMGNYKDLATLDSQDKSNYLNTMMQSFGLNESEAKTGIDGIKAAWDMTNGNLDTVMNGLTTYQSLVNQGISNEINLGTFMSLYGAAESNGDTSGDGDTNNGTVEFPEGKDYKEMLSKIEQAKELLSSGEYSKWPGVDGYEIKYTDTGDGKTVFTYKGPDGVEHKMEYNNNDSEEEIARSLWASADDVIRSVWNTEFFGADSNFYDIGPTDDSTSNFYDIGHTDDGTNKYWDYGADHTPPSEWNLQKANNSQDQQAWDYGYRTFTWDDGIKFMEKLHGPAGEPTTQSSPWGVRNFITFADGARMGYGEGEEGKPLSEYELLQYPGSNRYGGTYSQDEIDKLIDTGWFM